MASCEGCGKEIEGHMAPTSEHCSMCSLKRLKAELEMPARPKVTYKLPPGWACKVHSSGMMFEEDMNFVHVDSSFGKLHFEVSIKKMAGDNNNFILFAGDKQFVFEATDRNAKHEAGRLVSDHPALEWLE